MPATMVDQLANQLPDTVELLPFCPFVEFEARLLAAEYAFYWNVFSFSVVLRIANGFPVFFYDRGHLSRTIEPLYDIGRGVHFIQEDNPHLIGSELARWYGTI